MHGKVLRLLVVLVEALCGSTCVDQILKTEAIQAETRDINDQVCFCSTSMVRDFTQEAAKHKKHSIPLRRADIAVNQPLPALADASRR